MSNNVQVISHLTAALLCSLTGLLGCADAAKAEAVCAADAAATGDAAASETVVGTDVAVLPDVPATPDTGPAGICGPGCTPAFPEKEMFVASWKDADGCEWYEHKNAAGLCVLNNPQEFKAEYQCWNHGQVNDWGVGQTCKPGEVECKGAKANCCHVDDKGYGGVCTLGCDLDSECGPNAFCLQKFKLCLPKSCGAANKKGFDDPARPAKYKGMGFPCAAKGDADGIGKPCVDTKDCTGEKKAKKCLGQEANLDGKATSFCTLECKNNADCGADGQCIYDGGHPYICAPKVCADFFKGLNFEHGASGIPEGPNCVKP